MAATKGQQTAGVLLIVSPIALLILSIIIYAIVNWVMTPAGSTTVGTGTTVANVIFFSVGIIAFLAFVPCLVAGIILLNAKPKV